MNRIARAIDVGYGNTKFSTGEGHAGDIPCRMFPSVAPVATTKDLSGGYMAKRDTVNIEIEGLRYEVGPDAMLAMPSNASRSLDLDFVNTDTYLALVRGALHYMAVPRVDHLYLGLPVSTIESLGHALEQRISGIHELPSGPISVKECKVVPQPVGGLYDFGVRNRIIRQMQGETNLLIDPGYFTLDWVVTSGTKMIGVRSGAANNGGMAAILRAIGEHMVDAIQKREGRPAELTENVLQRMDESLRTGKPFKFNGRVEDLQPYRAAGYKVVEDALNKMVAGIGSLSDIDNIVIVGGSAHFYTETVEHKFPGYDIRVAHEAAFANVRGFQMMANRRAQQAALEATTA